MNTQELRETFDHFDRDNNGQIDFKEYNELLDTLGAEMDEGARRVGFDVIDTDGNGTVEFQEFVDWWTEQS